MTFTFALGQFVIYAWTHAGLRFGLACVYGWLIAGASYIAGLTTGLSHNPQCLKPHKPEAEQGQS